MKNTEKKPGVSAAATDASNDAFFYKRRRERYRQCAREKKRRHMIVAGIIILLVGVSVASIIHGFTSNTVETMESEPFESSVEEISEEPSEISMEESSRFLPEGEQKLFTPAVNKFSSKVKKELGKKIQSQYVILYDATEDEVLFQKNCSLKCYPASTTKMLTAITASNILSKDTVITVGDEIEMIGEDSSIAYLMKGMKLTFEMLVDALLLPSGNDAAYTIAVNAGRVYAGDDTLSNEEAVRIFVEQMNAAAKEIGCKNTHFVTPDGFHDPEHYTTAEDLARIAAYAKTIPIVSNSCKKNFASWELIHDESSAVSALTSEDSRKASEPPESSTDSSTENEHEDESAEEENSEEEMPEWMAWSNSNALLNTDSGYYSPYADGMKTGFTDEAGTCVVASATINGHTLIASVMMAPSLAAKYDDATLLFKEGFQLYNLTYQIQGEE